MNRPATRPHPAWVTLQARAGTMLARLSPRERRAVTAAAWVLGLGLAWWLAVAPALNTLRQAPERHARLDAQLGQMQRLAGQAQALRSQNSAQQPPNRDAVLRALETATGALGQAAQLSVLGDRATLSLKGVAPEALAEWLAQVRVNARLVPLEAKLNRNQTGWHGSLVLGGPGLS